jgi:hypothetical protein
MEPNYEKMIKFLNNVQRNFTTNSIIFSLLVQTNTQNKLPTILIHGCQLDMFP